jgi:hypothetical protein
MKTVAAGPLTLIAVGLAFWFGRIVGPEPLLPPRPAPWDKPLGPADCHRLPSLGTWQELIRVGGGLPDGYTVRVFRPHQLPPLGRRGRAVLYVVEDGPGCYRAARITLSADDFREVVRRRGGD